jgi:chromosome segregation ATPase
LIQKNYQAELKNCETKIKNAKSEHRKQKDSLKTLQGEVVKAINGESKFDSDVLNDLIAQTKGKIQSSSEAVDRYQSELANQQQYLTDTKADYGKLISWADMFEDASPETRRMITAYLIQSVKVSRGYELDITLNVAFEQFFNAV